MSRVLGVLSLRASTYREIAKDTTATRQAFVVWLVGTLVAGFFATLLTRADGGAVTMNVARGIVGAVVALVFGLIGWAFGAWLLAFIAKVIVRGKTTTLEMLRVTGYVHSFDIVGVLALLPLVSPTVGIVGISISLIVAIVVAVLRLIGYLTGVREAARISMGSAIIAAVIAAVIEFIVRVTLVLAILGLVFVALGLGATGPL